MKKTTGFSLIEVLLVLSVTMLLAIGAFLTYKMVSSEYKTNLFNKQISETIAAFRPIFTQSPTIMNLNLTNGKGYNLELAQMKDFFREDVKLRLEGDRYFLDTALPLEVLPYMSGFSDYNDNNGMTNLFMIRLNDWKYVDYSSCVKIINYQYPFADKIVDTDQVYNIKKSTSDEKTRETHKLINKYCSLATSGENKNSLYIYYTD